MREETIYNVLQNKQKVVFYAHLRSSPFIPKEIEDMLWRNWEPNSGSCADDYTIGLARISALLKSGSNFKFIQCRNVVPLVSIGRIYAGTETAHHSFSHFHHAFLPFW